MREPAVHLVLRHDFVLGREEKPIHASVTQIDLHDFSRLTRTYGLAGFHCITAMQSQHQITAEILDYWQQGFGQNYNPDRSEALTKLFLHRSFEACLAQISEREGQKPVLIGTSARVFPEKNLDYQQFSSTILPLCRPVVIQFGTSWDSVRNNVANVIGSCPPSKVTMGIITSRSDAQPPLSSTVCLAHLTVRSNPNANHA